MSPLELERPKTYVPTARAIDPAESCLNMLYRELARQIVGPGAVFETEADLQQCIASPFNMTAAEMTFVKSGRPGAILDPKLRAQLCVRMKSLRPETMSLADAFSS